MTSSKWFHGSLLSLMLVATPLAGLAAEETAMEVPRDRQDASQADHVRETPFLSDQDCSELGKHLSIRRGQPVELQDLLCLLLAARYCKLDVSHFGAPGRT